MVTYLLVICSMAESPGVAQLSEHTHGKGFCAGARCSRAAWWRCIDTAGVGKQLNGVKMLVCARFVSLPLGLSGMISPVRSRRVGPCHVLAAFSEYLLKCWCLFFQLLCSPSLLLPDPGLV